MIIQKVQIFEIDSPSKLQDMINRFLKTKRSTGIVDIKYNHYIDPTMDENTWYTAMVIYTDFPDDEEVTEGGEYVIVKGDEDDIQGGKDPL